MESLEQGPREITWTACGQRVGLMTRAAANQMDTGAAHMPPPFPTVLTLEPALPCRMFLLFLGSASTEVDSTALLCNSKGPMDRSLSPCNGQFDFLYGSCAPGHHNASVLVQRGSATPGRGRAGWHLHECGDARCLLCGREDARPLLCTGLTGGGGSLDQLVWGKMAMMSLAPNPTRNHRRWSVGAGCWAVSGRPCQPG